LSDQNPTPRKYDELLEEFGQKVVLLKEEYRYVFKTKIAAVVGMDPSNLIALLKQEKNREGSPEKVFEMLEKLNSAYPKEFKDFVVNPKSYLSHFVPQNTVSQPEDDYVYNLEARLENLELNQKMQNLHQEATTILLLEFLAEARGTLVDVQRARLDELKEKLAQKNNPQ
jgi:hypothetical protein